MVGKLIVDHGIGPFDAGVRLFHTRIKRFRVDGSTIGKCHDTSIYPQDASFNVQLLHVLQGGCHGTAFVLQHLFLAVFLGLTPVFFQAQTLRHPFRCQRQVLIIGTNRLETVDMIPLRLETLAAQGSQIRPEVDIIEIVAVQLEIKPFGKFRFQFSTCAGTHPRHLKGSPLQTGILYHGFHHRFQGAFSQRHHIRQLILIDQKAKQQKIPPLCYLRMVIKPPAVQIGKRKITVLPAAAQRIPLDQLLVGQL